jgi:hypothetical protein
MRADIRDGPEHNTLQAEAGYIDARPYLPVDETSCNARPDHTFGSNPEELTVSTPGPHRPSEQM